MNSCAAPLPLQKVPAYKVPLLDDDLSRESLAEAVSQSLAHLNKIAPETEFNFYSTTYSAAWLAHSLTSFLEIVNQTSSAVELTRQIRENFTVYRAGNRSGTLLVTGYYEPVFDGSLTPEYPFIHPLYSMPPDLVTGRGSSGKEIGRMAGDTIIPYWSRAEIESQNILAGLELVYLADPVDVFILHVQGSGKIRLRDNTVRGILFAGKNGLPYRSIGRLLVDEGKMELAEVSMPAIRGYLNENPEELQRVLHHNPSYIFFRWDPGTGLVGNLSVPLTAGRTVAADQSVYPAAGLAFLKSERPILDGNGSITGWMPFTRFVLIQDTGSAIKGPGRLDLFWGTGSYAETAAGNMKHPGELFFLVKKRP